MSTAQFLTVDELALELVVAAGTIYGWRHRNYGPPAHKVGSQVRYARADVDAWLATTREPAAR